MLGTLFGSEDKFQDSEFEFEFELSLRLATLRLRRQRHGENYHEYSEGGVPQTRIFGLLSSTIFFVVILIVNIAFLPYEPLLARHCCVFAAYLIALVSGVLACDDLLKGQMLSSIILDCTFVPAFLSDTWVRAFLLANWVRTSIHTMEVSGRELSITGIYAARLFSGCNSIVDYCIKPRNCVHIIWLLG